MDGSDRFSVVQGQEIAGRAVNIEAVEGGYVITWAEVEIVPEDKREMFGPYRRVERKAVSENLAKALTIVERALTADRVTDRKWGG